MDNTQIFPEVCLLVHTACDISSKRNLEIALGWPVVIHKLPPPPLDFVAHRMQFCQEEDFPREGTSVLIPIPGGSDRKQYCIPLGHSFYYYRRSPTGWSQVCGDYATDHILIYKFDPDVDHWPIISLLSHYVDPPGDPDSPDFYETFQRQNNEGDYSVDRSVAVEYRCTPTGCRRVVW